MPAKPEINFIGITRAGWHCLDCDLHGNKRLDAKHHTHWTGHPTCYEVVTSTNYERRVGRDEMAQESRSKS